MDPSTVIESIIRFLDGDVKVDCQILVRVFPVDNMVAVEICGRFKDR